MEDVEDIDTIEKHKDSYEIILVNDCSPDNSGKILEWYAKKDNRIKVISRDKNGGLSTARNTGLDAASCEYIYFIDSDDWIDSHFVKKMLAKALDENADIVMCDCYFVTKDKNVYHKMYIISDAP